MEERGRVLTTIIVALSIKLVGSAWVAIVVLNRREEVTLHLLGLLLLVGFLGHGHLDGLLLGGRYMIRLLELRRRDRKLVGEKTREG